MREEFEKLVTEGKIQQQHLEPLLELATSGYCMHRSWGFGRITTIDTVFSQMTIDFPHKAGHKMDLSFASEALQPIPKDHILARKASDMPGLHAMAAQHHMDLIKLVLQSYGGQATLEQVQQVLVPDVIADDWKKWWEVARKEMKKDGHFQMPIKKSDPIIFHTEEVSLQDRLLGEFENAKGLKARISVVGEILKNLEDLEDPLGAMQKVFPLLNQEIINHQRTQPHLSLDAIFLRDDLVAACKQELPEATITASEVWQQHPDHLKILGQLPAARQRRALESFKAAYPEDWRGNLLGLLNEITAKLAGECAHLIIQEGHLDKLKDTLARLISQHSASSELLLWLAKERSDSFADILGPEVFRAMLTAIERDQFNEKRSNRLPDLILQDQELLVELIEAADIEVIKDLTRALKFSASFDDMDKRSLLARIVKAYPSVQSLITGDEPKQEKGLVVSWESLERRKKEYEDLVQKKIPANSKEIAVARSYGDLRENHEYKSAKEMQKLLMNRKAELETDLARARGTDFADVKTEAVGVGTLVTYTDLDSGQAETISILGAWDGDPDKGLISYLTPLAQSLIGLKPQQEKEFTMGDSHKRLRIDKIEKAATTETGAPAPQTVNSAG